MTKNDQEPSSLCFTHLRDVYTATSPQGQARTVPSSLAVSKTHVNAISPTTPLLVLLVLSAPLVLLVCSLCSLSVPCAPCLFLVLFACNSGGIHAPPRTVCSLCSLSVPCALYLYCRRYSCPFFRFMRARGRPLQIAEARSDSSSVRCAVPRPVPTVSRRSSGSPCGAARTPPRVWPRHLAPTTAPSPAIAPASLTAPSTAPSSRRPATVLRRRPDRTWAN